MSVKVEVPINVNISGSALKSFVCFLVDHNYKALYLPAGPMTKDGMIATRIEVCFRCGRFKDFPMTFQEYRRNPWYFLAAY